MRKGLFWVVGEPGAQDLLIFAAECDENGVLLEGQLPYNSRKANSYAHKQSWKTASKNCAREIRNKPWNYFPRGRVEIRNGKATIYHNPILAEGDVGVLFRIAVLCEFGIGDIPSQFVSDGSSHYKAMEQGE